MEDGEMIGGFECLSFVTCRKFAGGRAVDFWAIQPTGDWSIDNKRGRDAADELAGYVRDTKDASLLQRVSQAIGKREKLNGVDVGFFSRISSLIAR